MVNIAKLGGREWWGERVRGDPGGSVFAFSFSGLGRAVLWKH